MKTTGGSDEAKRRAGESAAEQVTDGQVVGLGTGSTAAHAIRALGRAVDAGLDVRGVPTSFASRQLARAVGVPLTTLDGVDGIDVAIDGADQVVDESGEATRGDCIKGGGAAHAREKVIDAAADRFLLVVDPSKVTDALDRDVPIEVLPAAWTTVTRAIEEMGAEATLRTAEHKDGPVVTDNGNLVLDCAFGVVDDPNGLARALSETPGVVEHGLFVDVVDEIHLGTDDGVTVTEL